MRYRLTYTVREVAPYINWIYYFHAWGMEPRFAAVTNVHDCPACRASWIASFPTEEQAKARESMALYDEAKAQLSQWADAPICHALFLLTEAYSDGDDIIINDKTRIPLLRQQHAGKEGYTLCLSDFVREREQERICSSTSEERKEQDIANTIGVFATTVSQSSDGPSALTSAPSGVDLQFNFDFSPFGRRPSVQHSTLSDRLAEATAEKMHEEVRKHYWGYAKDEHLTMRELHEERFQGIRPAVGYPSLPDQSVNFLIDQLLHLEEIGITLSENGAMHPHCSVSGFMFGHPQARYFSIGSISEEQLTDYARRRGISAERLRIFLTKNLY